MKHSLLLSKPIKMFYMLLTILKTIFVNLSELCNGVRCLIPVVRFNSISLKSIQVY